MTDRDRARALAQAALERGRPLEWFDALYREADAGTAVVPWADLAPNPHLLAWLDAQPSSWSRARALDVGCGYGDNAGELARRGYDVDAVDVSPAAIEAARARFEDVRFHVGDASAPPEEWRGAFDLVTEIYTLQALPTELRAKVAASIATLVAPGGTLLVVARGRDDDAPEGQLPWPLTKQEILALEAQGLALVSLVDQDDGEDPPVRRFVATLRRGDT